MLSVMAWGITKVDGRMNEVADDSYHLDVVADLGIVGVQVSMPLA